MYIECGASLVQVPEDPHALALLRVDLTLLGEGLAYHKYMGVGGGRRHLPLYLQVGLPLCVAFVLRLQVGSLAMCYICVTPPGGVSRYVLHLCHASRWGPSLCVTFVSHLQVGSLTFFFFF
jgi:hypothetical protein